MSDDDLFTDAPAPSGDLFTDEPAPKSLEGFLGNAVSNAGRYINPVNIAEGLGQSVKQGLYDLPKAAAESSIDLLKGGAKALTGGGLPDMEDVKNTPIIEKTREMTEPIAKDPVGYAYKNPIDTAALLSAPFLALSGGTEEAAAPKAENPIAAAAGAPTIPTPGESIKELPIVAPGAKTGEPHALFAYNDKFGPGGAERPMYNIFGDPEHPAMQEHGWGSSVTKADLDKAGIPITGRQPGTEKFIPLGGPEEPAAPGATAPPGATAAPGTPSAMARLDTAANAAENAAKEVKNYVSRGYEGFAKKPGALADVADWVQEKSQMMAAQQIGITPNQARQLGRTPVEAHNAMRAIGQYAIDKDIVSPATGLSGMLEKNAALTKQVGKTLGDYREMADKLAGEVDPKAVVAQVRKALDDKYMRTITTPEGEESAARGAYGGQSGAYLKALQEVEDADKTHTGMAEAATELNHAANKAARNMQPETPFTDVANEVSRINNERIKQLIGQDNAAKYEQALREYGVNKKIANALKFKSSGEVKRFGPGSIGSNITQKAMDEFGYRLGAKAANKLSTSILKNPALAGNLPSLFKEFINQVEDIGHDVTGLAHGGIVPPDVRSYVAAR